VGEEYDMISTREIISGDPKMIDIHGPEHVQIQIGKDGKLWVNVDGVCRLRVAASLHPIIIEDERR